MRNLRYLKFYNSHCPQECKTDNKIYLPEGLNLPLEEVRCLHWLKFPEKKLPNDFNPINLVDLKLPYSKIEQLWDGFKVYFIFVIFISLSEIFDLILLEMMINPSNLTCLLINSFVVFCVKLTWIIFFSDWRLVFCCHRIYKS